MSERFTLRTDLLSAAYALRLRGPLADDPTARILHALVLAVAIWYALWSVILLPLYPQFGIRLLTAVLQEVGPLAALVLLQFGLFRQASWVYLLSMWASATIISATRGGIHSTSLVAYVVIPILATWLFGFSTALWAAGLCLSTGLILALLELTGVRFNGVLPVTPIAAWAILAQTILIGTVPVAQILQTLQATLTQSRRTQKELQQYKESLELEVQSRTAELVEARDQALAANRAKTSFLANMSHELRTPLNAILGFSTLVSRDSNLSDQQRKDLAVVATSGEHLLDVIDDVLDMAKIETGGITVENGSFDVRALVSEIVNMLRKGALAKNLELLLDVSPAVPRFVRSDSGKLRQVLTNLVGNAVKYTEEGSVVVRVDTRPREASEGLILVLEVEDTGIGIAPEDRARIFDAFIQAGTAGTRQGTGLGLAISRNFVQLLGGTIQVESEPGHGSRFRVEVPVERAEPSEVTSAASPAPRIVGLQPGQPDYRVLVVEDQKENWLLLQRLLQTAGFQVRVVDNGAKAIEVFETWRPHFIWMDLRLPGLGGLEAAKRIRASEAGRDVKIAAVTASAFASQREEVLAAGLDDFLRKPYRPAEIFDCMARHLGVRYIYRETLPESAGEPVTLRPEELAALPATLLNELESAIISLDQIRIANAVRQVTEHSALIGSALSRLADQFAYTPILHALKSSKSRLTGASA